MACGTQLKTAHGALQQATAKEQPAAETPAEETPAKEELAAEKQPAEETARIAVDTRKPVDLTQESYEEILDEVKAFVDNLNLIIKDKNYYKWRSVLSKERLNEISSRDFLANASNNIALKSRGIVLREPRDYFDYVVVPSRANSRVDKIEIIDNNRVKAFYIDTRKDETVRLYELARMGDSWTIIR
jgi:HD-GYP domain-containing protein (c-di-GMP phosphodiesterase class II)